MATAATAAKQDLQYPVLLQPAHRGSLFLDAVAVNSLTLMSGPRPAAALDASTRRSFVAGATSVLKRLMRMSSHDSNHGMVVMTPESKESWSLDGLSELRFAPDTNGVDIGGTLAKIAVSSEQGSAAYSLQRRNRVVTRNLECIPKVLSYIRDRLVYTYCKAGAQSQTRRDDFLSQCESHRVSPL